MLDVVLRDPGGTLPSALLRDRMALEAAVACLKLENRVKLRPISVTRCVWRGPGRRWALPAICFGVAQVGADQSEQPGWRDRLMKLLPDQVAEKMQNSKPSVGSPVAQAAQMLADVLEQFPRQEAAALMLADVTLAGAIGRERVLPLLAAHLTRKDIRAIADGQGDPVPYVHRAVIVACDGAIRRAADLSRRAARLRAVAPKLRAKGAAEALALFRSHDAVSPSGMLSPMIKGTSFAMTDRAARRLCDRLVDLGAVRELTGRLTFRLYGV